MALSDAQIYNGDGSTRDFTILGEILSESHLRVWIDDILQSSDDWDLLGNTVLFNDAPDDGANVQFLVSTTGTDFPSNPSAIGDVSININDVITVAANIGIINTVSTNINDAIAVGSNIDNVNDVASNKTNIDAVVNNKTNIDTVANNKTNIDTIGENISNVINVSNNIEEVKALNTAIEDGVLPFERIVVTVNNIDELLEVSPSNGDTVIVKDLNRGGTFIYDSTKVAESNNGGTIFDGWVRQYSGAVNVKWFGALGDGTTDDTIAIQKCYNTCKNTTISFEHITECIVSGEINVFAGTKTIGSGLSKIKQITPNTGIFVATEQNFIEWSGLVLTGVGASDTASTSNIDNDPILVNARAFGIFTDRCNEVTITNCTFMYFKNYAIRCAYGSQIHIENNNINGTYPDDDIPYGDTSHQQFGIIIYAESASVFDSNMIDVLDGISSRHNGQNIYIKSNTVTQTAIAICVFPGFKNVNITDNKTYGTLSQHSIYSYPYEGLTIDNNQLVATQAVGIKVSCNVPASCYIPKDIMLRGNLIKNCSAPGISLEMFDKYASGDYSVSKSSVFFTSVIISENIIEDSGSNGMVIACTKDIKIYGNILKNINTSQAVVEAITFRSVSGVISNNIIDKVTKSAIGGVPYLSGELSISDNIMTTCCSSSTVYYTSLATAPTPFAFSSARYINWYGKDAYVYNDATTEIYKVLNSGVASSTAPTGTGTIVSGEVSFNYVGLYADIKSEVALERNKFIVGEGTLSQGSVNLNDPKFSLRVVGNYCEEALRKCAMYANWRELSNNNFQNGSQQSGFFVTGVTKGNGGSDYLGTASPISGTYEKMDKVWNTNPLSGGTLGWICVARGTPGTWKIFGTISA